MWKKRVGSLKNEGSSGVITHALVFIPLESQWWTTLNQYLCHVESASTNARSNVNDMLTRFQVDLSNQLLQKTRHETEKWVNRDERTALVSSVDWKNACMYWAGNTKVNKWSNHCNGRQMIIAFPVHRKEESHQMVGQAKRHTAQLENLFMHYLRHSRESTEHLTLCWLVLLNPFHAAFNYILQAIRSS